MEDAKDFSDADSEKLAALHRIHEAEEIPHSELLQRPALKIKQSLTRDFSIENLKRYAGSHKRLYDK